MDSALHLLWVYVHAHVSEACVWHVCMYVCMCVCMHACVFMYVRVCVENVVPKYVWISGVIDEITRVPRQPSSRPQTPPTAQRTPSLPAFPSGCPPTRSASTLQATTWPRQAQAQAHAQVQAGVQAHAQAQAQWLADADFLLAASLQAESWGGGGYDVTSSASLSAAAAAAGAYSAALTALKAPAKAEEDAQLCAEFLAVSASELSSASHRLLISDTKTRVHRSMPSLAQKRTSRLQLLVYKRLFDDLTRGYSAQAKEFFPLQVLCVLCCAVLCCAVLCCAVLCCAALMFRFCGVVWCAALWWCAALMLLRCGAHALFSFSLPPAAVSAPVCVFVCVG